MPMSNVYNKTKLFFPYFFFFLNRGSFCYTVALEVGVDIVQRGNWR